MQTEGKQARLASFSKFSQRENEETDNRRSTGIDRSGKNGDFAKGKLWGMHFTGKGL